MRQTQNKISGDRGLPYPPANAVSSKIFASHSLSALSCSFSNLLIVAKCLALMRGAKLLTPAQSPLHRAREPPLHHAQPQAMQPQH